MTFSPHSWGDHVAAALVGLAVLASGCDEPQAATPGDAGVTSPVRVTEVALGTQVGLDKKVTQAAEVFGPEDTIHVSVVTEGTSTSTLLSARWTKDGRVLEETRQYIAPVGSATSEFHVSKPGGFEKGEYEVEVLVEGKPVQKRRFTVK
jgi:hypothetical protein